MTRLETLIARHERALDNLDDAREHVAADLLVLRQLAANPQLLKEARKQLKARLEEIKQKVEQAG